MHSQRRDECIKQKEKQVKVKQLSAFVVTSGAGATMRLIIFAM